MRRNPFLVRPLLAILASLPFVVSAQTYPDKPITLVVVFAAGGTADIVSRIVAAQLTKQLGQQVIVDNKPGAGGTLGAATVTRSKPDGYTMLSMVSSHATAETMFNNRPYDLVRDFAPISTIGTSPYWVLVNPEKTKAANFKDFVATLRARPGEFSYAHGGSGGLTHLASEMMKMQGKLDMLSIPFKGNAPAITEVLAGRIDMLIDQPASSETYVKAGKLRPLAVTSKSRLPGAPDIPTMSESGFPGFEAQAWFGLAFPRGTPVDIVERMNREVTKALADNDVKAKLEAAGVTPGAMPSAQFGELIKSQIVHWRTIINTAKIDTE